MAVRTRDSVCANVVYCRMGFTSMEKVVAEERDSGFFFGNPKISEKGGVKFRANGRLSWRGKRRRGEFLYLWRLYLAADAGC